MDALKTKIADFDKIGAKLTKRERALLRDIMDYACGITAHKMALDPDWPTWRKQEHWRELDPAIAALQERCKALTGRHCAL